MKAILGVFIMTLLIGCAGLAPKQFKVGKPSSIDQSHSVRVGGFENWRLVGRIGLQRGSKGFSAGFRWRQVGREYEIWVTAPLNRGTYRLEGNEQRAELRLPSGETFSATQPEALMLQHLGWFIPLNGTHYWIRGIPDPAIPTSQENLDRLGRWTDFQQDLWRVNIFEYMSLGELDLPGRLSFVRDDLKVRIVIKQWERR